MCYRPKKWGEEGSEYIKESNSGADHLTLTNLHQPPFLKLRALLCCHMSGTILISDELQRELGKLACSSITNILDYETYFIF